MGFKPKEVDDLLAQCHRRCCICHKFCGFKIETHHIKQKANGGNDDIKNAIPLCFECHAEVALYNPEHPKGRKYTERELLQHKKQWLEVCQNSPQSLISAPINSDIGSLESMVLELEFNLEVAKLAEGEYPTERIGCSLKTGQYDRSISEGTILLLSEEVKNKIIQAYLVIGRANNFVSMFVNTRPEGNASAMAKDNIFISLRKGKHFIEEALEALRIFLNNKNKS